MEPEGVGERDGALNVYGPHLSAVSARGYHPAGSRPSGLRVLPAICSAWAIKFATSPPRWQGGTQHFSSSIATARSASAFSPAILRATAAKRRPPYRSDANRSSSQADARQFSGLALRPR
jgi:hypothetical protein